MGIMGSNRVAIMIGNDRKVICFVCSNCLVFVLFNEGKIVMWSMLAASRNKC